MSKLRRILITCLSICCVALSVAIIAACGSKDYRIPSGTVTDDGSFDKNNPNGNLPFYYPQGSDPSEYEDPNNTYVINTTSLGGLPIDGVKITVSKDDVTLVEGRSSGGKVKFNLPEGEYDLSYSDLPNGYFTDKESTLFKLGSEHEVTTAFGSAVINATAPSNFYYNLGNVMYDFRVTDTDGNTVILSDLVAKKRLVVLNLWYTNCSWCLLEFPAINEAYNMFKDTVEIVALAPSSQGDSPTSVKNFKNTFTYDNGAHYLDFILAYDSANLISHFNISGYPTSIFIDRYGVIAYAEPQAQTSPNTWIDNFARFTADDYKQSVDMGDIGGNDQTGGNSATPPPSDISPLPSDRALTEAFLDQSMLQGNFANASLSFRGPDPNIESEASDAALNWPFHIGKDGRYIYPSNVGTNNTFSILYTSVELEADQTLTVEVNLNTESNNDILYIFMNRSTDNYYSGSGNTGGWTEVTLYTATRYTKVDLIITYTKNNTVTVDDEFVGLRNLKIATINENTSEAVDIRTEVASYTTGSMSYKSIYLGSDGFYHVYLFDGVPTDNDPLLFVDILNETLWSDRHIPNYSLVSYDGISRIKSLYNICYWVYNKNVESDQDDESINNNLVFGDMGSVYSGVIIDGYYIQTGNNDNSLVPVSEKVRAALEKFVEIATYHADLGRYYENGKDDNTWLELCSYYRTAGQGSHTAESHKCLATTNPGLGKILEYAIELHEGENSVYSTEYTMKNRDGGLFYKFTAPKAGVYKFESKQEYVEGNFNDPLIIVWGNVTDDPFRGDRPIATVDDSMSADRMKSKSNNFKLYIYLEEGQTIYPQITSSNYQLGSDISIYKFDISWIGETHYELQIATTGEGMWTSYDDEMTSDLYYIAVPTVYDNSEDLYYHRVGDDKGSVMYIDFLMPNFFDLNGNSLYEAIKQGAFNFTDYGIDFTSEMYVYYYMATDKPESDPTYGMVEANNKLVQILTMFVSVYGEEEETVESGIWKAFAYYWEYYGPTAWVDMPTNAD